MPEALEIDVDQLMERVRDSTATRRSEGSPSQASAVRCAPQLPAELARLQRDGDLYQLDFTSHRKVLGRLVVFVKNLLRQLLSPIFERQCAFNVAVARALTASWEQMEVMRQQQAEATHALQTEVAEHIATLRQQQAALVQALRQELEASRQQQAVSLEGLRTEILEHIQALARAGNTGKAAREPQAGG